jgi:hypothetical protein
MSDQKTQVSSSVAMSAAVEAAADSALVRPSDDELKDARHKAEALVADPSAAAGMKDLQNLTLAIGLPTARAALRQLVEAGSAGGAEKDGMLKAIERIPPLITEPGCMQVDFYNTDSKEMSTVYLELDVCNSNHDLGAEMDKLKRLIDKSKWGELLKHFSVLIAIGRSVFAKLARENADLISEIRSYLPENERQIDLQTLSVDMSNTTLFVLRRLPRRVGIFVRSAGGGSKPSAAPGGGSRASRDR